MSNPRPSSHHDDLVFRCTDTWRQFWLEQNDKYDDPAASSQYERGLVGDCLAASRRQSGVLDCLSRHCPGLAAHAIKLDPLVGYHGAEEA